MSKTKIDITLPTGELVQVSAYEVDVPTGAPGLDQDPRLYVHRTVVIGDDGDFAYEKTWTVTDRPTGAYYLAGLPDRSTAEAVGAKLYELGAQTLSPGIDTRAAAIELRRNAAMVDFMEQAHRETFGTSKGPASPGSIRNFLKKYRPPRGSSGAAAGVATRTELAQAKKAAKRGRPAKAKAAEKAKVKAPTKTPAKAKAKSKAKAKTKAKTKAKAKTPAKPKVKTEVDAASILLRRRGLAGNPLDTGASTAKARCLSCAPENW